ncbi:MAG: metal-dependent transcriptional regulator [Flavobacteriaceae bacterium]|nr:metal-dependent transcriptional regulator [Flavobacteriaceae bacterium]
MLSQAEENYIKAIYSLETQSDKDVSTNLIAEKIQTKASSVTDMIKKLSEKQLVVYKKYQGVQLSDKGKKVAMLIVRKHRLWESFLVDILNFSWDEVHVIAEQLEHIKSEKLIERLDRFLEYPSVDPHGDPIPDKDGNIEKRNKVKLSALKENEQSILLSVKDSSADFLKYLNKKKIAIGNTIKVLSVEPFDRSMHIEMNSKQFIISENVADNLYLKNIK